MPHTAATATAHEAEICRMNRGGFPCFLLIPRNRISKKPRGSVTRWPLQGRKKPRGGKSWPSRISSNKDAVGDHPEVLGVAGLRECRYLLLADDWAVGAVPLREAVLAVRVEIRFGVHALQRHLIPFVPRRLKGRQRSAQVMPTCELKAKGSRNWGILFRRAAGTGHTSRPTR